MAWLKCLALAQLASSAWSTSTSQAAVADACAEPGACQGREELDEPTSLLQTQGDVAMRRSSSLKLMDLSTWDGESVPKGWKLVALNGTDGFDGETLFQPRQQLLQRLNGSSVVPKTMNGTTAIVGKAACYQGPSSYMKKCILAGKSSIVNVLFKDGMTVYENSTCTSLGYGTIAALCPDLFYGLSGVCSFMYNLPLAQARILTCPKCQMDLIMGFGAFWRALEKDC